MARIAVVDKQTNIVENLIVAEMSDEVAANTFFIDATDLVVKIGDVYNRATNQFEISIEEQDQLQSKYSSEYTSLIQEAWEE